MYTNQVFNQTFHFSFASKDQLYRLHNASLEILERVGVVVYEPEALRLFREGGAYVKENLVRIPAHMVEEAIRSAPSRIAVASPSGKRTMFLERNNVYFGTGTDLPMHRDINTLEVRPAVYADLENSAKVIAECEHFSFIANNGLASDVSQELHDLFSLKAMRSYCDKPNLVTATGYGNLKAMIDICAELAGGYEELRRNPTMLLYNEPVSPLMNSTEAIQKLLLCAEYGIPTTYAAGGVSGGTSPVTLSGSFVQGNAEGLAGLVLHQLKKKGAPFIYGYVYGAMDMRTTTNIYGGPELGMMHALVAEMGKFYDLPVYGTAGCTDALRVDAQAGLDAGYSVLCALLSGQNLVHDCGYTGSGLVGNLEMTLFVDETIGYMKRFVKGVQYDDESLALDLIESVGPGGDFVSQKHTFSHFREELFYPKYMNRKQYAAWHEEGRPSPEDKLNKKARTILAKDHAVLLSEAQLKVFNEIIAGRQKALELGNK